MSGSMFGGGGDSSLLLMNPQLLGPQRQMMYGQALLGQAADVSPVRSPWQAAARAVSGLVGGYEMGQGQQGLVAAGQAMQQHRQDILQQIMGGGSASDGTMAGNVPSPSPAPAQSAPSPATERAPSVNDPNVAGNNYGNIRPVGATVGFNTYDTPQDGIGAMAQQLAINQKVHGLNTLRGQITRWAPSSDGNNPDQYATTVAKATGLDPDAPLDFTNPDVLAKVIPAMAQVEHGKPIGVGSDVLTAGINQGLNNSPIVAINTSSAGGASDTSAGANPTSGANPGGLPPGILQAIQMRRQGMALMTDPDPLVRQMGQSLVQQSAAYTQLGAFGPAEKDASGGVSQRNMITGEYKQVVPPARPEAQIMNEFNALQAKLSQGQPLSPAEQAAYGTDYYKLYPITTEVRGNTTVALQKTPAPPDVKYPWEVSGGQPPANFLNPRVAAGAPGAGGAPGAPATSPLLAETALERAKTQIGNDDKSVVETQAQTQEGERTLADTQTVRSMMAGGAATGWGAEWKKDFQRTLEGLHVDPANIAAVTGITSDQTSSQVLDKVLFDLSSQHAKAIMGSREASSALTMFRNAYPNIGTDPNATEAMTRFVDGLQYYARDRATAMKNYQAQRTGELFAGKTDPGQYRGLMDFDNQFRQTHDPRLYTAAGLALARDQKTGGVNPSTPYNVWSNGLSDVDKARAMQIAVRMSGNPNGVTVNGPGKQIIRYTPEGMQTMLQQAPPDNPDFGLQ